MKKIITIGLVVLLTACTPQQVEYQVWTLTTVPGLEDCLLIEFAGPTGKPMQAIRCADGSVTIPYQNNSPFHTDTKL